MAKKKKTPRKKVLTTKVNPNKAAKLANEAIAFCRSGDYKRGIALFKKAEARSEKNEQIFINMAIAYHALSDYENARKYYAKVIRLKPEYLVKVLQNGINELTMNKLASAECCIGAAYDVEPGNISTRLATGSLLLRQGEKLKGVELLRACYAEDSKLSSAALELAEFSELTPADIAAIEANIANGAGERKNDKYLYLALGKGYDIQNDTKRAFAAFTRANELFARDVHISCQQAAADLQGHYDNLLQHLTPAVVDRLSGLSVAGERLIFVIGLPKSGIHEVALLLQDSSKAVVAGELNWCNQKIYQMLQNHDNQLLSVLNAIDTEMVGTLVADYLKIIHNLRGAGKFVINCKVSNFVNVWFIKTLFPKAKIFCARRNLEDQALAIYLNNTQGMEYLNELLPIGEYCKSYTEIMALWDKLYPGAVTYFDYDAFVENPEAEYRKLISVISEEVGEVPEFIEVSKPSLNVREVYKPEVSVAQKYAEYCGSLNEVLKSQTVGARLDFANFNTEEREDEGTGSGFKLNFGGTSSPQKKEEPDGEGFKLKFD